MSNNSNSKHSSGSKKSSNDLENLRKIISNLREKSDILEDELGTLRAEKISWDLERSKLDRELQVQDDKLRDVTRNLSLSKDSEQKAIKRYDDAMGYSSKIEGKIDELRRMFDCEKVEFLGNISELKGKLIEKELDFEGFKEELGFKLREKEKKLVELNGVLKEFENVKNRNEGLSKEISRLEANSRGKDERISELIGEKEGLEKDLEECSVKMQGEISQIMIDKVAKIKKLEIENGRLEREKREISEKYDKVEERFLKLEGDVVDHLCVEAKRGYKFSSSMVGRILSGIIDAVDVKGDLEIGEGLEEGPAFASHANDMECASVAKTNELLGENGSISNQKSLSPTFIQISDSEDDEKSCHNSGLKRARTFSVCSTQKHNGGSSSDGSPRKKHKMKLEHLVVETPKQTMPFLRECNQSQIRKVRTPGLEGNNGKQISSNNQTEEVLKYMATINEKIKKQVVENVADIGVACKNDPEFCTSAVCALYRNGLLCSGQRGIEKSDDMDRGIALAKFLTDGDLNSGKKRTMEELKQHDSRGLVTCTKLAMKYSEKLFEIFKSNQDPLFSHLSNHAQYR